MKKTKKNIKSLTIIKVDKKLDKYTEMNPFKEKVEKANEIIKSAGIPKFSK